MWVGYPDKVLKKIKILHETWKFRKIYLGKTWKTQDIKNFKKSRLNSPANKKKKIGI